MNNSQFVQEKSCKILTSIVSARQKSINGETSNLKKTSPNTNDVLKCLVNWLCAELQLKKPLPSNLSRSSPTAISCLATLLKEPVVKAFFVHSNGVRLLVPFINPPFIQPSIQFIKHHIDGRFILLCVGLCCASVFVGSWFLMASSSSMVNDLEDCYANIQLEEEEDEVLLCDFTADVGQPIDDRWCLVGKFLTSRVIDFLAMQHTMASLWQPGKGMPGFMSDTVVRNVANYIGIYVKSDPKNFNGIWRNYLRVRTSKDIEKPLKRRMKLKRPDGDWLWTNFKYEFLPTFCFICGIIGHSERFCHRIYDTPLESISKPYGLWVKADPPRKNKLIGARWLRTGTDADAQFFDVGGNGGDNSFNDAVNTSTLNQGVIDNNGKDTAADSMQTYHVNMGNRYNLNVENNQGEIGVDLARGNDFGRKDLNDRNDMEKVNPQQESIKIIDSKRRRIDTHGKEIMKEDEVEIFDGVGVGSKNGSLYSHDYIDVQVTNPNGFVWRLTGCYGEPNRSLRFRIWNLLRTLSADNNLPWCVIGDLNNVVSQDDKKGGAPYPDWLLEGFNQALIDSRLCDLSLSGYPYTWEKGRGSLNWIEVRLDRALVSQSWLSAFNSDTLTNLEVSSSDHSPIILVPTVSDVFSAIKQFRFENSWLREPLCFQIVQDSWGNDNSVEIMEKIRLCGQNLETWGKNLTGSFKKRIGFWKKKIAQFKGSRDADDISAYNEAEKQLFEIYAQREVFWRQRSKQLWLRDGDNNSRYFHASATTRQKNNAITKLQGPNGVWCDWNSGLNHVIQSYFEELFCSSNVHLAGVVDNIRPSLTAQQNVDLLASVTEEEEVKAALFQMHPEKSPGPDGMTPGFFQKCWSIVKKDVVALGLNSSSICQSMGIQEAGENSSYLGLPCTSGRNKNVVFGFLKDKASKRIMSWEGRHKHKGGLGFKDLRQYNIALLGKQAWRLLVHDSTLVSKVFKARYFPNGSFLSASLGNNPSYVWRSIFEAKDLIMAGARRSIASGIQTLILGDPWLPDVEDPYVHSIHPGLVNQTVASLMCVQSKQWDKEIIEDLFDLRSNNLMWNQKNTTAAEEVLSARTHLYQWQNAQQTKGEPPLSHFEVGREVEHWTKPTESMVKVNVDGATFEATNAFGYGFISRNTNGAIIEARCSSKSGNSSPKTVEVLGIKEALSWIKGKTWSKVVIESDCLVAVQAIHTKVVLPSLFASDLIGKLGSKPPRWDPYRVGKSTTTQATRSHTTTPMYSEGAKLVKAFRNIPGVDIVKVERLTLLKHVPNSRLRRFVI
uniref:Uncharacterized protein n=1 Tax=Cannabis sativa TaxID=3483 RepID=A0A803NVG6_CANSA